MVSSIEETHPLIFISRTVFLELRRLSIIRHLVAVDVTKTIVGSLVLSCNVTTATHLYPPSRAYSGRITGFDNLR